MKAHFFKLFALSAAMLLLNAASSSAQTWYQDSDNDGFGNNGSTTTSTTKPSGYVANNIDGDDNISHTQSWLRFGTAGIASTNGASTSFAVSGKGVAYMGFISGTTSISVYKKGENATDWATIASFPTGTGYTHLRLAAGGSTDTLWAVVTDNGSLKTYKYDPGANSWSSALSSVANGDLGVIAVGKNDTPVVAYTVTSGGQAGMHFARYNPAAGTWTVNTGVTSAKTVVYIGLTTDIYGNSYVAAYQSANTATVYCKKIAAGLAAGTTVTDLGAFATTTQAPDSIIVAADTATTPNVYVLFRDNNNSSKATVRKCVVSGPTWSDLATSISTGTMARGSIVVDRFTNDIYIAYSDGGATNKAYVLKWNGSSFAKVDSNGTNTNNFSLTLVSPVGIPYWAFKDGGNSNNVTIRRYGPCRTWTGASSTTWATTSNWYTGEVPASGENVVIKTSATNAPAIPSGTSIPSFTVGSGSTVNLSSGTVSVTGTLTVNGTTTGGGTIQLSGSSAQTISGTGTVANLELANSTGATIQSGSNITITGTYTPTSGTLTTNNGLTLKSDASGTARIAAGSTTNYISGNVTAQRYNPGGRRAYRYYSHPFSSDIALSSITDNIDITGPGGSTNGFTNTSTNNPSAQWYDPTAGTGATATPDPGWTFFTSATASTGANAWKKYEGIKVLLRGAKGEGLNTTSYTPSAATFDYAGAINMGDQVVTLTKGTNSGYNLIGNPYPSQVDIGAIPALQRGSNVGANFWVWDPNGGTKGTYTANSFGSSYILPAYGAFFVLVSANSNNTITFKESDKSSGTAQSLFKTTANNNIVELKIQDTSNITWDQLQLIVDSNANVGKDNLDATKFLNSEVNFFTYGGGSDTFAIDRRPYLNGQIVPLCLWSFVQKPMFFNVTKLNMPQGTYLFLEDSLTGTSTQLNLGDKYNFTITSNPATSGNRFKLRFYGNPGSTNPSNIANLLKLKATISPNPATDIINVKMEATTAGQTEVSIVNMIGQEVFNNSYGTMQSGTIPVRVSHLATGIYNVQIRCGAETFNTQIVKQ